MSELVQPQWYIAPGGQKQGPLPESSVRQMLSSGQLSPRDVVWRDGMPQWAPAGSVPGLVTASPPRAHAPPPPPAGYAPQPVLPIGYAGPRPAYGPYAGPPSDIGQNPEMRWLLPVGTD